MNQLSCRTEPGTISLIQQGAMQKPFFPFVHLQ